MGKVEGRQGGGMEREEGWERGSGEGKEGKEGKEGF